jgi:hypothetical protein
VAPFTITRSVTVNGLEPVTVSTGTFTALKVTTVITQSNVAVVSTNVAWYVDGVGQVKSVTTPAGSATTTFDLTGYSPMACLNGTCACNALVNSAPLVDPVYVATAVPVASGGSILDGTYYLTANRVYTGIGGTTGPTGGQVKNTYSLQSGLMNWVGWHTGLTTDTRSTARITTSGNQVTATTTCGSEAGGVQGYTASTSQIQFIITNSCPGSTCDPGADAILTRQ